MRTINELSNAFGRADDGFAENVYQTLAYLQRNRNRKSAKITYYRIAAVIAIICVLSAGTALALSNTWGILDFLSGRQTDVTVLPEASAIVQKEVFQEGNQTDSAAFTVREAVYDGQTIFIVIDVKPSLPEYLLLGPDVYPSDHIANMGPIFSERTGTIADYASANHKVMFNTSIVISGANCSIEYLLKDDGTLVYMVEGNYAGNSVATDVELRCVVVPFVIQNGKFTRDMNSREFTTLSATFQNTGMKETVTNTESVVYSDCGVRVDKVTLKSSEIATYAEIKITIIDAEKYAETDNGLCFEFLDIFGERLPNGAASGGGIDKVDDTHYIETISLQAMEKLPSEVILRGFNCWDKNRYETHSLEMK